MIKTGECPDCQGTVYTIGEHTPDPEERLLHAIFGDHATHHRSDCPRCVPPVTVELEDLP